MNQSIKKNYLLLLVVLITSFSYGQYRDTILDISGKKAHFDYKTSWTQSKLKKEINQFKENRIRNSFKASTSISQILDQIPVSIDPCRNGGFEDDYAGWTGLSLTHQTSALPIENGLTVNPGIASLPFTGTGYGQNYTSIETTGLDPIISVATPAYNLQRTAPGTSGTQSLRLGNDERGYGAEGVAKRFVVTAANAKYYFQYAIVMDRSHSNLDGSVNGSEVFFIAEATDLSGTTIDKVVDVASPSNPFINAVNGGVTYYRDWRCAYLDLSSHIGQEVVVMFINSDCSASGHKGYTYVDDICEECVNSEGDINLNLDQDNCLDFPELVGGTFNVPDAATNVNISLEIYQSNTLVNTLTSVTISPPNYSFTLQPTDFPDQTDGTCYDLVAVLTFDLVDLNGNIQTVTQLSSKVVNGVQDGEVPGLDNDVCFCEEDQGETDYCCDTEADNLVDNGNFEQGNAGFTSAYSLGTNGLYGTAPQQYYVGTNVDGLAISPLWNVNDHSFCTIGSINDEFLMVNGKTTQSSGSESVIWEQTIVLSNQNEQKHYKFCANLKNMPQATFDILPKVEFRVTGGATYNSGFITVNTNPADPCEWQLEGFDFMASGTLNIQIVLKEDEFGDGNDLAIDDISLQELLDPDYSITVQHQGDPQVITGSLYAIDSTDDQLDCENATGQADYYWYVIEVTGYSPLTYNINTLGWGNTTGSYVTTPFGSGVGPAWNLTTTYPGYPFAQDTLYLTGLYTPANPDCCLTENWTYQLTFNHKSSEDELLSDEQKEELKELFGVIPDDSSTISNERRTSVEQQITIYPNPASTRISIDLKDKNIKSYQITDSFGSLLIANDIERKDVPLSVSVAHLRIGVYVLTLIDENGIKTSTKFIKK